MDHDELNESCLDDADKVRRKAIIVDNNVWQQKSKTYNVSQLKGAVDFSHLEFFISQGASLEDLLAKGFSEADLIKLGLIKKKGLTTFGSDDVVSGHDTSDTFVGDARKFGKFSGEKMSNLALKKFLEMHPPFGMANLPSPPKFAKAPVISKSIKYMNQYTFTKSKTPQPGGPNYSPFAGMYKGPSAAPNSSGSADSSVVDK